MRSDSQVSASVSVADFPTRGLFLARSVSGRPGRREPGRRTLLRRTHARAGQRRFGHTSGWDEVTAGTWTDGDVRYKQFSAGCVCSSKKNVNLIKF